MLRSNKSSSRFVQTSLALAALAAAFLMQTSCYELRATPPQDTIEVPQALIKPKDQWVHVSPITIPYLVANQLELKRESNQAQDFPEETVLIAGLKDKDIEDKINSRLKSLYQDIRSRDIPPYRGVRAVISEGSELFQSYLSTNVTFNYNSVLSLAVTHYRTYAIPDHNGYIPKDRSEKYRNSRHIACTETLNIDLSTGADIPLQDVFADDVNYVKLLSDYVAGVALSSSVTEEYDQGTYWGHPGFKLVAPFKGIRPDQRYYLLNGGLVIVLDELNPEFDTTFNPYNLQIGFDELGPHLAITERFYDPLLSLFAADMPIDKEFLPLGLNGLRERTSSSFGLGKGQVRVDYSYPPGLNQTMVDKVRQLSQEAAARANSLRDEPEYWEFHCFAFANLAGPYVTIEVSSESYVQNRWESQVELYCYDSENNPVSLQDVFVSGYDYEKLIKERLAEAMTMHGLKETYSVEELYQELQFTLGTVELLICTKPLAFSPQHQGRLRFAVAYRDFGCDNMTIFETKR